MSRILSNTWWAISEMCVSSSENRISRDWSYCGCVLRISMVSLTSFLMWGANGNSEEEEDGF